MGLISRDDVIAILNDEIYTEECEFDDGDCLVCWVVDDKDAVIEKIKRLPTYENKKLFTTENPNHRLVVGDGFVYIEDVESGAELTHPISIEAYTEIMREEEKIDKKMNLRTKLQSE